MRPTGRPLAALAPALLLAACAPFPPAPAPVAVVAAPQLRAGQSWVYEQIDPYNGERVRSVTYTLESAARGFTLVERGSRPGDPVGKASVPAPWEIASDTSVPGNRVFRPPVTFDPPFASLRFPLRPGTSWHQTVHVRDAYGNRYTWLASARALDWERVTTPAGSFAALRVDLQWNMEDEDVAWHTTHVREVLWYAPEVQRWVRRELRYQRVGRGRDPLVEKDWTVWELTAYHRPG